MSHNSKSQCRLHRGTDSSIPEYLADHWLSITNNKGPSMLTLSHPVSFWQLVRHLISTRCTLFAVSDTGTKTLKRISRQTIRQCNSLDNKIWWSTVSELLLGPKTLLHIVYPVPCSWGGLRRQRMSEQIQWTVPSGIQTVFLRGAYWQPGTVITVDVQLSWESCWV